MIYLFLLTLYFSQVQQLKWLSSWLVITDKVQSFALFSLFYSNMMFNSNRCYLTRSTFSFSFVIKPGNFEWVVIRKCKSVWMKLREQDDVTRFDKFQGTFAILETTNLIFSINQLICFRMWATVVLNDWPMIFIYTGHSPMKNNGNTCPVWKSVFTEEQQYLIRLR